VLLLQGVNGKAVFFVNSIITATGWTLARRWSCRRGHG